jgi:Zn-finger nucleic acid-binding protein
MKGNGNKVLGKVGEITFSQKKRRKTNNNKTAQIQSIEWKRRKKKNSRKEIYM